MEGSKKVIRTIMICVVLTAVVMGIVYYYHETQDESMSKQGTLITSANMGCCELWLQ